MVCYHERKTKFVSLTNIIRSSNLNELFKSQANTRKSNGPNMDPCENTHF